MLDFVLDWWWVILLGVYLICGIMFNLEETSARKLYIQSQTLDHPQGQIDRMEDKLDRTKLYGQIHLISFSLGLVVFLLAGLLVTLLKSPA